MVRIARLIIIASMILGGALHADNTRQKSNDVTFLEHVTDCKVCGKSIQDMYWPQVVTVECGNEGLKHLAIVHTECIKNHKETHECTHCKAKLSDESKTCINHTVKVKDSPDALVNPANPLYQRYTSAAPADDCSICMEPLGTWPNTIMLHDHHAGAGHAYHRTCLEGLRDSRCPNCRAHVGADVNMQEETLKNLRNQFTLAHIQRYEKLQGKVAVPIKESSFRLPSIDVAMKNRWIGYPAAVAALAFLLHTGYVYNNATSISVSDAAKGTIEATFMGAVAGLFGAGLHYLHDWHNNVA